MKRHIYKILFLAAIALAGTSCEVQEFDDLNGAEVSSFEESLSRGDLQDLVGGILYSSRLSLGTYYDDCGVIGREYWRFSGSDPRFTTDLLGGGSAVLDNNTFYITNPWAGRYRTVKNANLILEFFENQDLSAQFTAQEITATKGFLKTFIGYELLLNLNLTYDNGIRVDVADANDLGPVVSRTDALAAIKAMLDEGATDLSNGGSDFPFFLSGGFAGFDDPSSFRQANRAIAARVAAYRGNMGEVLNALNDSFFTLDGSNLFEGIFYTFSEDQRDFVNPLFISVAGSSAAQARVVTPSFIAAANPDDERLSKVVQLAEPITLDDLSNDYILFRYKSNSDAIPIIRNEELILLYAEANISINPSETVNALNIIRASAGLTAYTGPTDSAALTDEMLRQRRYSLFAEGHRWIDMRRYGRLDQLPLARPDDNVWEEFPIPLTENQ